MRCDQLRLGTRRPAITKMTVTLPNADIKLLADIATDQETTMTAALAHSIRMTSFIEKALRRGATVILQEADGTQRQVVFTQPGSDLVRFHRYGCSTLFTVNRGTTVRPRIWVSYEYQPMTQPYIFTSPPSTTSATKALSPSPQSSSLHPSRPGHDTLRIIEANRVRVEGVVAMVRAHTWPGHPDQVMPFDSEAELREALQPHLKRHLAGVPIVTEFA